MSDYTPPTSVVRSAWASLAEDEQGIDYHVAASEFDRWLKSVKAEVWAEGFQAACDETPLSYSPDGPRDDQNPYCATP